jgi:hypothetical protein
VLNVRVASPKLTRPRHGQVSSGNAGRIRHTNFFMNGSEKHVPGFLLVYLDLPAPEVIVLASGRPEVEAKWTRRDRDLHNF